MDPVTVWPQEECQGVRVHGMPVDRQAAQQPAGPRRVFRLQKLPVPRLCPGVSYVRKGRPGVRRLPRGPVSPSCIRALLILFTSGSNIE